MPLPDWLGRCSFAITGILHFIFLFLFFFFFIFFFFYILHFGITLIVWFLFDLFQSFFFLLSFHFFFLLIHGNPFLVFFFFLQQIFFSQFATCHLPGSLLEFPHLPFQAL